jgi:predicted nucleotidyltransferase
MARVGRVNRDRHYLGKVSAVVLFGSMLKLEVDRPSDVDIAVEISPKKPILKRPARRRSAVRRNGRRTAIIFEGYWTGNSAGIGRSSRS